MAQSIPSALQTRNFVGCLLIACSLAAGCHQTVYKAGSLPDDFLAATVESTRQIDLSRLAKNAPNSEAIFPGDLIEVTISTGIEDKAPQAWPLRVSKTGEVNVPLVGPVIVDGMPLPDAEQAIRRESIIRKVYRDPHVAVLLKSRMTVQVTVVGAVENPGTYQLPQFRADLLSALIAAGGMTDEASTIVEIRDTALEATKENDSPQDGHARQTLTDAESIKIDLISASEGNVPDYHIHDGSVIMVREQDPKTIQVIGLVRKPDQFEIPPDQDVRLLDAIALAGGRTIELADKVHIVRNLDGKDDPIVITASVREAKKGGSGNLLLAPGDVISVEETPLTFTVGTIQSFVRFGFSAAVPGL